MNISANQLAQLLKGTVVGDGEVLVNRPSKIEEATAGSIAFLANMKYESYAYSTAASILLVPTDFEPKQSISSTLIKVDNVYGAVSFLLEQFGQAQNQPTNTIHDAAIISKDATLGSQLSIGAYSIIESGATIGDNCDIHQQVFIGNNVKIGKNCTLLPGVRILHDTVIGDNVRIHPNAVIGADGFGNAPQPDGSFKKIPQIGNVIIGNDVEIGANTTIDRATMGSTIISDGVKLDNLVMIGHNVKVGKHTAMAAQVGVAGSTVIGAYCMIGGQVGIAGHIQIADKTKIVAKAGVIKSITTPDTTLSGAPALPFGEFWRINALVNRLPKLMKRIKAIEKQLKKPS